MDKMNDDTISRRAAINALINKGWRSRRYKLGDIWELNFDEILEAFEEVPSAPGVNDRLKENADMLRKVELITLKAPKIKRVIFNKPATIVFWTDGTKTVVKCGEHDAFDPEKGIAMCFVKKMNANKGNYNNIFKPWVDKYYKRYDLLSEC